MASAAWLLAAPLSARTPLDPPNPLPPPQAQSRLANPVTTAPVQQDSLFAAVVAAQPAERVVLLGGVSPYATAMSESWRITWRGSTR